MHNLIEKAFVLGLIKAGTSYRQAEAISGVPRSTIGKWMLALDEETFLDYASCKEAGIKRKDPMAQIDIDALPDDPEELKRIVRDLQFEIDLKEAIVEIVKKDHGVDPKRLPNRQKALLVDAVSKKKRYSIKWMTSLLGLAPASYYYHKKRKNVDKDKALRARVTKACSEHPMWGYRRIKLALEYDELDPMRVSEKRIRKIMRQEGLQVPRRRKNSRYNSYRASKDTSELPNAPLQENGRHDFSASAPNKLWLTDVTEFKLPDDTKVFLSPVMDCYDGALMSWSISTSSSSEKLTDPMLISACKHLKKSDRCTIHTDRGGQYHASSWKKIATRAGLERSMSRKGHSPDNARMEGFFGRMKMEFFDARNWKGVSAREFIKELDRWLRYYNAKRPKQSLGWKSPLAYRYSNGFT